MKKTVLVIIGIMIFGMNIFAQIKISMKQLPKNAHQIHTQWMEKHWFSTPNKLNKLSRLI